MIRLRTQATNTSTTTNYANVTYELLPYNMASATVTINDVMHCHPKTLLWIRDHCSETNVWR